MKRFISRLRRTIVSPLEPFCSILITFAPRSANVLVTVGPATCLVKSMTRKPDNGPWCEDMDDSLIYYCSIL